MKNKYVIWTLLNFTILGFLLITYLFEGEATNIVYFLSTLFSLSTTVLLYKKYFGVKNN